MYVEGQAFMNRKTTVTELEVLILEQNKKPIHTSMTEARMGFLRYLMRLNRQFFLFLKELLH